MNVLPNDILDVIYKQKHNLEFQDVLISIRNRRLEYYDDVISECSPYFIKSITNDNPDQRDDDDFFDDVMKYVEDNELDVDCCCPEFLELFASAYTRNIYVAEMIDRNPSMDFYEPN